MNLKTPNSPPPPTKNPVVVAVIPALNEAGNIGDIVRRLLATKLGELKLERVVVVDNGSTDGTGAEASAAGANVISEPERGYGAACLAGMNAARNSDIILFLDADGSDCPEFWPIIVSPICEGRVDLVVGARQKASEQPAHQRFGTLLAIFLMRTLFNAKFTDLGPYRAIRAQTLFELRMTDRDFGWTIQMQLKALSAGIRYCEIPVEYKPRARGKSKVSGTIKGTIMAGYKILGLIGLEMFSRILNKVLPGRRKQYA